MKYKKGEIHIGTSGWHYKHWIGNFYPESMKAADYFEFYMKHFHTVEINNSFYKLPPEKTFTQWKNAAHNRFIYAVKANRFITHMKKLKDPEKSLEKFLHNIVFLEDRLGPVLFQLPPKWKCNIDRLKAFLEALPSHFKYTIEFRDQTWYAEEVYALLKKHNVAFCIYELEHHLSPIKTTADFIYIRLHGPEQKYQGKYTDDQMQKWAEDCKRWASEGIDVFLYFDNDQNGYAVQNALLLNKLVETGR